MLRSVWTTCRKVGRGELFSCKKCISLLSRSLEGKVDSSGRLPGELIPVRFIYMPWETPSDNRSFFQRHNPLASRPQNLETSCRRFSNSPRHPSLEDSEIKVESKPTSNVGESDTFMGQLGVERLPVATIVGRPNVGKSRLYNRLTQRQEAIVYDTPNGHVTRDIREGVAKLGNIRFRIIDTAGLEPSAGDTSVLSRTAAITRTAMSECHFVFFLVDGREGIHTRDDEVAEWLRRCVPSSKVVLLINKCEDIHRDKRGTMLATVAESYKFGFGDPLPVSAETGEGLSELYSRLQPLVENAISNLHETGMTGDAPSSEEDLPLQLAICGRPNVGKSTILNKLIGKERSLTGPEPGLTRDAVRDSVKFNGRQFWLVDTAGWIQRAEMSGSSPEARSAQDARNRLRRSQVVAIVLDANDIAKAKQTLKRSEMALARWVVLEGKALVIVVNKMDELDLPGQLMLKKKLKAAVPQEIHTALPQIGQVPILFTSALNEDMREKLLPVVEDCFDRWCTRLTTGMLNKWLAKVRARSSETERFVARVRYLTQVKARPPTFVAFTSGTKPCREADMKYLCSALRDDFKMNGIPVRINQRHNSRLNFRN